MARHAGISQTQVHRIWSANGIKPHTVRAVEPSRDEDFEARFWDVIGLYLNPPDRALVLCCDEHTHRLALQRTEPGLPLGTWPTPTPTPVRAFVRHGTAKLFAALYYLDGKITSRVAARRDHDDWLRFLEYTHEETPRELQLHLIADNDGTREYPEFEQWLAKHTRVHLHVVPASGSWVDHVEHLFRNLGRDAMSKGSFGVSV